MNSAIKETKMISSKLCANRKLQICLKWLIVIVIFGIYFIILLRESIAALEVTNKQANYVEEVSNEITRKSHRKFIRNHHQLYKYQHRLANNKTSNTHTTVSPVPILTTVNPIYEYSEEINAAAEHDFTERQAKLLEVCAKYNFERTPNAWEFFISPGHNLAWCNVFKAGSSTWIYYFNILAGYNIAYLQRTKSAPIELARKKFPRPSPPELAEALTNSLSFLIVRDPFERLLSAYRDKLEGHRNKYYKILGEQIVKNFRKIPKKTSSGPTFKEFLMFLLQNYKSGERFDEHWSPIYTFCTPCSINYTLIAKMETFQRDSEYIIRQAGLETLLLNKLPHKKIKSITNQSSSETKNYIEKYFSQIDIDTLNELIEVYGPDFELFGYNSTKYVKIVQSNVSF